MTISFITKVALKPGLYIVPTPIGNLEDITLRALNTLTSVDLIAAEDTRITQKLLQRYGIKVPLISHHNYNENTQCDNLLSRIQGGQSVALVSDAGMPLISDPGFPILQKCYEHGIYTTVLPGASSVICAVAASGLPPYPYHFEGFLPAKSAARKSRLANLSPLSATLLFFESARRLENVLTEMAEVLGNRKAVVLRELSKKFETRYAGTLEELVLQFTTPPKGEIVIVVEGRDEGEPRIAPHQWQAALCEAMAQKSLKEAVAEISTIFNIPKREVYQYALQVKA